MNGSGQERVTIDDRVGGAGLAEPAFVDSEVRDLEGVKAIFPKGVQLVKSSSEQFYNAGQEVLGQSLKTGEAIGQLYKAQFDAANDNVRTNVNAAAATVQATAKQARR